MNQESLISQLWKIVRKLFLSTFVIVTFIAYALHERFIAATSPVAEADPPSAPPTQPAIAANPPATQEPEPTSPPSVFLPQPQQPATATPLPLPTNTPTTLGQYKDGEYVGAEIDAFYGLVRVKATVQNGQITAVDFLEYPSDRRTSVRINRVAVPYLQSEAIQAQSARVNIISGATLTSEAFIMSLQSALDTAKTQSS